MATMTHMFTKVTTIPQFGRAVTLGMTIEAMHTDSVIIEGEARRGLSAQFTLTSQAGGRPVTYFASRLVDETVWYIDAMWEQGKGGRVHRNRPFGCRWSARKVVTNAVAEKLNKAARLRQVAKSVEAGQRLELHPVADRAALAPKPKAKPKANPVAEDQAAPLFQAAEGALF